MSTASSTTEKKAATVYSKPRANVYTVLLVISLLAIIVGCVFLYLFMAEYEFKIKGGPMASLQRPGATTTQGAVPGLSSSVENILAQASTDAAAPIAILPL